MTIGHDNREFQNTKIAIDYTETIVDAYLRKEVDWSLRIRIMQHLDVLDDLEELFNPLKDEMYKKYD